MGQLSQPVDEHDHIRGASNAPLTLVEYGDYECPDCGQAFPFVQEVERRMGDRLRFVFRNFPLTMHPHAEHAAEAAEVAATQGKFWEMHDALFTHQRALDDAHLIHYATELGIDGQMLQDALANHTMRQRVQQDLQSGDASDVGGTPWFFINGRSYEGSYDADSLVRALEAALAKIDAA
jgi:protein-disulfide isomerase